MSIECLDLHGVRHNQVKNKVENFVFFKQELIPLIIICGNSSKMIESVTSVLEKHGISYNSGKGFDYGKITVERI